MFSINSSIFYWPNDTGHLSNFAGIWCTIQDLNCRFNHKEKCNPVNKFRGQSYKDFYTKGQIHKRVLKHENNVPAQTFVGCNVRTQYPNIFAGLQFSLSFKQQLSIQMRLFCLKLLNTQGSHLK